MTRARAELDVGQRLAAGRMQRGLAQVEVARAAGLAPSYLSRVEAGKVRPTFATVMRIANALDADLAELFGPSRKGGRARGPCPVTARGQCLLDLVGPGPGEERYTQREIRLLRRFAAWLKAAAPSRVRSIEVLLEDLAQAARSETPEG